MNEVYEPQKEFLRAATLTGAGPGAFRMGWWGASNKSVLVFTKVPLGGNMTS